MRKLFLYLFVGLGLSATAQFNLKGRLLEDSTGTAIAHADVFIPELSIIVSTNNNGEYEVRRIPKGKYYIQFSGKGYKTRILPITIKDSITLLDVRMALSIIKIDEVVVYGYNTSSNETTANEILQMSPDQMRNAGAMNLSDGIAKMPGVNQLTTGSGISKPVIRGLFGNRIQTVLMGLRFDNQQWQDEHGLGLSDVGIDKVEIIKGPASLLYGSEAMGGVINIIEEKPAPVSTVKADLSTRFFSNTYGNATDAGVKGAGKKINWRIRLGEESHADYSDGNNKRVLNSRFGGYFAKAGLGFQSGKWISQNNYMFSQGNFGFLMDPIQLSDPPDDRLSRGFDRPHHTVNINMFSSQNSFFTGKSKIKFNLGFQNNNRQEQEGGSKISLDMILNTYMLNAVWMRNFGNKAEWSIGTQNSYQTNRNEGSRTIIPDANQISNSLFSYMKLNFTQLVIEGGIRYDYTNIETFETGSINSDTSGVGWNVTPFNNNYGALNGSLGISWFSKKHWNVKSNLSTGYRPGNLAELSSNGLHEGTVRYEIGDPNAKIEQNACADILIAYSSDFINVSASVYHNQFQNYIYLAPTTQEYIGFQIYRYKQQNAVLQGVEMTADVHPKKAKWFNWYSTYSYVKGTLENGDNLIFIPAPKLNSDIKLTYSGPKNKMELFFKPGITYVFEQDRPGDFETVTKSYLLVNSSLGMTFNAKRNIYQVCITGNNLSNETYYDHLSRFKYFGIYNIGRNISINFKINFN